jgi:acetoin utilization protein AcuB
MVLILDPIVWTIDRAPTAGFACGRSPAAKIRHRPRSQILRPVPRSTASRAARLDVMNASELMSRAVIVTTPEETIGRALHLLEDSGVRHLPVVSGNRVIGVLSDRDVREYRLPIVDELEQPALADDLMARPVSEAMNRQFVFVDERESVTKVIEVMLEYGVGAVPVLDRETSELRGMISYVDVLRLARELL